MKTMLLASPFRLMFLAAALAALLPVTAWLLIYLGVPAGAVTPQWHAHELLFGMVPAAAAGFLLTAVANWTGTAPLHGKALLLLFLLWLLARILLLVLAVGFNPGADWFGALVLLVDLAFLPCLLLLVALPVIRTGNRRQWVLLLMLLLWSALHFYAHAFGTALWPLQHTHASHITLDMLLLLIVLIGSRIVPMFTRNALQRSGIDGAVVRDPKPLLLASMLLGAVLILTTMLQLAPGWRALVAAALGLVLLLRLGYWQGWRAWRDPLVWMLHVGILWLALALLLRVAALYQLVPASMAYHALTVGGIGGMILAIITRVPLGHTGRAFVLPKGGAWIYWLLLLAAITRVLAMLPGLPQRELILTASVGWVGAFALWIVLYWPVISRPRVDGKPG